MGPVDVLVNNAGITRDMTFKKMTKADWDIGAAHQSGQRVQHDQAGARWHDGARLGTRDQHGSVNGQKGAFGQTNYSAAKAGMHGFTKALALEVAKKGVTVNTISPGYIGTKMVTAIREEILNEKIIPQIPVGRLGKAGRSGRADHLSRFGRGGFRNRRQHLHQRRPAHVLEVAGAAPHRRASGVAFAPYAKKNPGLGDRGEPL